MEAVLEGVFAAALTPLKQNLTIDAKELSSHCHELLHRGPNGIALFGTTGEGCSFSLKEKKSALGKVIENGIAAEKIIVGNISVGLGEAVSWAKACLDEGCRTHLIAPPCFFKGVTEAGVIEFYRQLILHVNRPELRVILYHIPQLTGVPLSLSIIEALLRQFPKQILGVKDSEGSIPYVKAIRQKFPQFKVFVARELQITEGVHLGAVGTISGMANIAPELITLLYLNGKQGIALNPEELYTLMNVIQNRPFIPVFKALLAEKYGAGWRRVRPPLTPQ